MDQYLLPDRIRLVKHCAGLWAGAMWSLGEHQTLDPHLRGDDAMAKPIKRWIPAYAGIGRA